MKSLRCAAVIVSACLYASATCAQESSGPPAAPPPPAQPAPPIPPTPARDAKIGKDQATAEMERAMAAAKYQAARLTFVKVIGKTEPAAYLGVSTSPVNAALGEQLKLPKGVGLLVDYVEPKSPAEEAQLRQYDVLHRIDDQLLINAHQFAVLVRMHKAGDEVTLTVVRRGEERPIKVKLVEREVTVLDANNPWGMPGFFGEGGGEGGFGGGGGGGGFRPGKVAPAGPKIPPPATRPESRTVPGFERMSYLNQLFTTTTDGEGEVRLSDPQGTLILQKNGVGHRLIVATPEGKWISTYQIDEPGQLKILPAEVSARYERMLKVYRRVNEMGDGEVTLEKPLEPRKPEKPQKPEALPTPTPGTN